jgi:cell division protein FtsB
MAIHRDKKKLFDSSARIKIILIIILLCIAFLLLNNNGLIRLFQEKKQNLELIEKKEELEQRETELNEEKEKLQNDEKYLEKTAREQYNMVKPGEKVYKVIEEDPSIDN